jgi:predicted nucleotidyltransferase
MITYTTNQFGLREKDMQYLQHIVSSIPAIDKVILYGSRATGNFEKASDIDLALVGENISLHDVAHIHYLLENESPLLLWADVLHYDKLKNEELKKRIDLHGKIIYIKTKQ